MVTMKNKQKTLVFLTGLGVDPVIALPFLKKISPDAKIILPDYSQLLRSGCKNFLNIVSVIDKKLPKDSILIGWSLGGLVATYLCHISPDKYTALITMASSPKFISSEGWLGISSENILKFQDLANNNVGELSKKFNYLLKN